MSFTPCARFQSSASRELRIVSISTEPPSRFAMLSSGRKDREIELAHLVQVLRHEPHPGPVDALGRITHDPSVMGGRPASEGFGSRWAPSWAFWLPARRQTRLPGARGHPRCPRIRSLALRGARASVPTIGHAGGHRRQSLARMGGPFSHGHRGTNPEEASRPVSARWLFMLATSEALLGA